MEAGADQHRAPPSTSSRSIPESLEVLAGRFDARYEIDRIAVVDIGFCISTFPCSSHEARCAPPPPWQQHLHAARFVEHPASCRQRNRTSGPDEGVERLGRLRALVRTADLGDPHPREQRQPPSSRLDSEPLFGLIRGVTLERALADADSRA